jgi:hypothetical protein
MTKFYYYDDFTVVQRDGDLVRIVQPDPSGQYSTIDLTLVHQIKEVALALIMAAVELEEEKSPAWLSDMLMTKEMWDQLSAKTDEEE